MKFLISDIKFCEHVYFFSFLYQNPLFLGFYTSACKNWIALPHACNFTESVFIPVCNFLCLIWISVILLFCAQDVGVQKAYVSSETWDSFNLAVQWVPGVISMFRYKNPPKTPCDQTHPFSMLVWPQCLLQQAALQKSWTATRAWIVDLSLELISDHSSDGRNLIHQLNLQTARVLP